MDLPLKIDEFPLKIDDSLYEIRFAECLGALCESQEKCDVVTFPEKIRDLNAASMMNCVLKMRNRVLKMMDCASKMTNTDGGPCYTCCFWKPQQITIGASGASAVLGVRVDAVCYVHTCRRLIDLSLVAGTRPARRRSAGPAGPATAGSLRHPGERACWTFHLLTLCASNQNDVWIWANLCFLRTDRGCTYSGPQRPRGLHPGAAAAAASAAAGGTAVPLPEQLRLPGRFRGGVRARGCVRHDAACDGAGDGALIQPGVRGGLNLHVVMCTDLVANPVVIGIKPGLG